MPLLQAPVTLDPGCSKALVALRALAIPDTSRGRRGEMKTPVLTTEMTQGMAQVTLAARAEVWGTSTSVRP